MPDTQPIPPPPVHQPSSGQIRYQSLTAASRVHQGQAATVNYEFDGLSACQQRVVETARVFEAYLRGDAI